MVMRSKLRDLAVMFSIFLVLVALTALGLALIAPGVLHGVFRGMCHFIGECS
jgi:hypothetical protein